MKILLINPPFQRLKGFSDVYFTVGLGYVAAALADAGHEVKIYNAELPKKGEESIAITHMALLERHVFFAQALNDDHHYVWQELSGVLNEYRPDVVGLAVRTAVFASAVKVSEICKKYDEKCPVIWGGPHATLQPREILNGEKSVEYVVVGEGEKTIVELAEAIRDGRSDLAGIDGVAFRSNGEVVINRPRQLESNLDSMTYPSRDLMYTDGNQVAIETQGIMGSRGCPYTCGYCSSHEIWGKKTRFRSVANVIEEIKMYNKKYGLTVFEFHDDVFTLKKSWVREFCRSLIGEKLYISWWCNTRANCLDADLLRIMKKSGCHNMHIGVETGSEAIAQYIDRRLTFDDIINASRLLCKSGIEWYAYFMIGFPTETREQIDETRRFMKELDASRVTFSVFTPYPGSPLYYEAKRLGLITEPVDWSRYSHQSSENCFVSGMSKEEFGAVVREMATEVDKLNTALKTRLKRVFAQRRYYYKHPGVFIKRLAGKV